MTARSVYAEAIPFLLSMKATGRLLCCDPWGPVMQELIRTGRLRLVPFGKRKRIPLEDVQRVAREGCIPGGRPSRPRPRVAPAEGVGQRIRDLRIEGVDP